MDYSWSSVVPKFICWFTVSGIVILLLSSTIVISIYGVRYNSTSSNNFNSLNIIPKSSWTIGENDTDVAVLTATGEATVLFDANGPSNLGQITNELYLELSIDISPNDLNAFVFKNSTYTLFALPLGGNDWSDSMVYFSGWTVEDSDDILMIASSDSYVKLELQRMDGNIIYLRMWDEDLREILGIEGVSGDVVVYDQKDITGVLDLESRKPRSDSWTYLMSDGTTQASHPYPSQYGSLNNGNFKLVRVLLVLDSSTAYNKDKAIELLMDQQSLFWSQFRTTFWIEDILTLTDVDLMGNFRQDEQYIPTDL
jgi:hypothetical protein